VKQQVGGLASQLLATAAERGDDGLDGFLAQLARYDRQAACVKLGDLARAAVARRDASGDRLFEARECLHPVPNGGSLLKPQPSTPLGPSRAFGVRPCGR
jgi:hypothetical protein